MRDNKLRRLWQSGAAAVNGWLGDRQQLLGRDDGATRAGTR